MKEEVKQKMGYEIDVEYKMEIDRMERVRESVRWILTKNLNEFELYLLIKHHPFSLY